MRKLFSNVKTWWNKKTYKQKDTLGAMLQFSLVIGLSFCMVALNAPLLQFALALGVIVVSLSNLRRTWKSIKQKQKEIDEQIVELNKQKLEKKMKQSQEVRKQSYDKDTQEALQLLFSENEKSDDMALMEVEKDDKNDVQTFNSTFNK